MKALRKLTDAEKETVLASMRSLSDFNSRLPALSMAIEGLIEFLAAMASDRIPDQALGSRLSQATQILEAFDEKALSVVMENLDPILDTLTVDL